MKKLLFLLILLFLCSCSSLLSRDEIGLVKNFISTISRVPKTIEKNSQPTESIQPKITPVGITGSINHSHNFVYHGPGIVNVPILLYHHILVGQPTNVYSVSLKNFEEQLSYLKYNEYDTISLAQLIQTISFGANLPEKSILLTFDDGNENVYLNAFPLMKKYEFTGIVYVVADRINAEGFLTQEQIKELLSSGWEIGSHGTKHIDLVIHPEALRNEIGSSKKKIENESGIKVISFAYPFGKATKLSMDWVKQIGYLAGMGLGITNRHGPENLFYLSRRQVESNMKLLDFKKLLSNE